MLAFVPATSSASATSSTSGGHGDEHGCAHGNEHDCAHGDEHGHAAGRACAVGFSGYRHDSDQHKPELEQAHKRPRL